MKNLYKYLFDQFNNIISSYRVKKIVFLEDSNNKVVKNQNDDLDKLDDDGFLYIENFFKKEDIDHFNKSVDFINFKRNSNIANNIISENSLQSKIIESQRIKSLIFSYLGKDAKLDFIEINKVNLNPELEIISEKWHYDIVGKRLKIFIFLNDCNEIFTEYVVGTNNLKHKKYNTVGSRVSDRKIKSNYNNFFKALPKKGSIFIFDTNGYHRGCYRKNNNIQKKIFRQTIQCEFSSKSKSDKLNDLNIKQIGVRNVFFEKKYSINNQLICREYLSNIKNSNVYFYDRDYRLD